MENQRLKLLNTPFPFCPSPNGFSSHPLYRVMPVSCGYGLHAAHTYPTIQPSRILTLYRDRQPRREGHADTHILISCILIVRANDSILFTFESVEVQPLS